MNVMSEKKYQECHNIKNKYFANNWATSKWYNEENQSVYSSYIRSKCLKL